MATLINSFPIGRRLMDGGRINELVDAVNNMQGNGTPDAGSFSTLAASGAAALSSTLAVTGASTLTGGIVASSPIQILNVPVTGGYAGLGTDVTTAAGTLYVSNVFLPVNKTLTGIAVMNGATVGTDKGLVALFDTSGNLLANSALAGATTVGADSWQEYAFTASYAAVGPANYIVAYQANGTTDNVKCVAASTFKGVIGDAVAGVLGTVPDPLTFSNTFTADQGPIAYLY